MSITNLQTEPIYCRSPYIIEVNETSPANIGSKVELYLWNDGDQIPLSPTYVLSKLIPAPNKLQMLYNISHYIKEYISFIGYTPTANVSNEETPSNEWCYVYVKRYAETTSNVFTLLDEKTYYAFDGYGYYEQGYNPTLGLLGYANNSDLTYFYDSNNLPSGTQANLSRYGDIRFIVSTNYEMVYTNLVSGATNTITYSSSTIGTKKIISTFAVYPPYAPDGNKVEYKDNLGTTLATWYFRPKEECKYTPVVCDFVNKLGAWQRVFFYKSSKTKISTTKKEYNLFARDIVNYDPRLEQRKVFNLNGKESINVNTDWVEESFNEYVLKPLMLSEVIRINNEPATLKTQSTELFEHINKKMINYSLEFEYANAVINNLI